MSEKTRPDQAAEGGQGRGAVGDRVVMQGVLGLWVFLPVKRGATGACGAGERHCPVRSWLHCMIAPILEVRKLRFRKVKRVAHLYTA